MTVAVLSSCYGGYDQRTAPPAQTVDADWIFVTDHDAPTPGWRVVVEPRDDMHPRLAAKVPKCLPWAYTDADVTVWVDASCQLLQPDSLERILDQAAGHALTQFVHPWRSCIFDEAEASVGMSKYYGRPVVEQADHYRKQGHPVRWGLWATGLIVRDRGCRKQLMDFGAHWLVEQLRWTYQDQISQAPLLRAMSITPHELDAPLHGSGLVEWAQHRHEL